MKMVTYNGGTGSYLWCSDPSDLVVGKEYEVILSIDKGYQTNYRLKGIPGEFNSCWFDETFSDGMTYMGIADSAPVIGERYSIRKIEVEEGNIVHVKWHTSPVKEFKYLGTNIYSVTTRNSKYLVYVI